MTQLLKVIDLCLDIEGHRILQDINFVLKTGQFTSIIGPNGGGKTSLVKIIIGYLAASSGKVVLKKGARVGYMPQKLQLSPLLPIRVIDFIQMVGTNSKNRNRVIKQLAIESLLDIPLQRLSGGQMQQVLLAQALVNKPHLLILDEPTQGLDVNGQNWFYQQLDYYQQQLGCAVLIISHELHYVLKQSDQVLCLNHYLCCSGKPESVTANKKAMAELGLDINKYALYKHHHDHQHPPA
ncbi:MAG: metal ABC transporter ATP-binding protein [Pseudomonadota bacterium]